MANIKLQDLTAMLHNTSRFNNNQFDMVHVEILLQTDVPLTPEQQWFVPSGTTVNDTVLEIFKAANLEMYPMSAQKVIDGTQDIIQQAEAGNLPEVINDAAKLMLRAIMVKKSFLPISGSQNLYHLAYDYKLFPIKGTNSFDFKVVLPFDGLGMPNGSKVQMTVIMPIGANIDPAVTEGVAVNNQKINELVQPVGNTGRKMVSFEYQVTDPKFTIRYQY
jgi:hypothetical protein